MKIIKLELDFLIGPIIKDVFSTSNNKLVTDIDIIDDDLVSKQLHESEL